LKNPASPAIETYNIPKHLAHSDADDLLERLNVEGDKSEEDGDDDDDVEEDLPLAQLKARLSQVKGGNTPISTFSPLSLPLQEQHHASTSINLPIQVRDTTEQPTKRPEYEEIVVEPTLNNGDHTETKLPHENKELSMCQTCGKLLLHIPTWEGRLAHLKRCSQEHGVTAAHGVEDDMYTNLLKDGPISHNPVSSKKTTSVHEILMAGARRKAIQEKHKIEAQAAANKRPRRGGWSQRRSPPSGACPSYKKIPGTDFVVDGFYYAKPELTSNYFLTHFHADHYGGLTKGWSAGIIYCSSVTANLVQQQLGVSSKFLHVLPMNQTMTLETRSGKRVNVTLIDANHCPGAVLFFFEVGQQTILHVGDFRWNRTQHLDKILFLLKNRRLDQIYLDTTYCDPKYTLPSQADAIQAAVGYAVTQVQDARRQGHRLLLLFGAYTIGKERIYLAVAKALGMKVYVDSRRYRILQALEWPDDQRAMITKNSNETSIWVVPLSHISMKKLPSYSSVKIGRTEVSFDKVVGFRPTGWSLKKGKANSRNKNNHSDLLTVCTRQSITTVGVPYSEHSAFPEIVDCLACLQPRIIVPTVNVRKSQAQINLLLEHLEK
jgi:DNA cross-link repair 1A protein